MMGRAKKIAFIKRTLRTLIRMSDAPRMQPSADKSNPSEKTSPATFTLVFLALCDAYSVSDPKVEMKDLEETVLVREEPDNHNEVALAIIEQGVDLFLERTRAAEGLAQWICQERRLHSLRGPVNCGLTCTCTSGKSNDSEEKDASKRDFGFFTDQRIIIVEFNVGGKHERYWFKYSDAFIHNVSCVVPELDVGDYFEDQVKRLEIKMRETAVEVKKEESED